MSNYNDYIFKNEKFIGNFEEMYKNCENPWSQQDMTYNEPRYSIVYNIIERFKPKRILEIGSGLGRFTYEIQSRNKNSEVLGIDISETAIKKAKVNFINCKYQVGTIMDSTIYDNFKPDLIILSWLQWFILDDLDDFILLLKSNYPNTKILNCFSSYPKEKQKYGADKFNSFEEVMAYYNANFIEWGSFFDAKGNQNNFFLCDYTNLEEEN